VTVGGGGQKAGFRVVSRKSADGWFFLGMAKVSFD
jgi:hypothetical protein